MIKVEQKNWILKQFSSAQVSVTSPRFSALPAAATLTATNPRIICCCCETWMIMNYHIQPGWQSLKAPLCREAAESTQVVTQAQSLLRSPHLPCNLFSCTPPSATLVSSSLSWLQEERSEGRGGARRGRRCLKTTSRDIFFCFSFFTLLLLPKTHVVPICHSRARWGGTWRVMWRPLSEVLHRLSFIDSSVASLW